MRLGLFGGSFDPVHLGHLLLAESCREQERLDEVWFVPAAVSPFKQHQDRTAAAQRVDMLELAVGGHEAFRVCRMEIDRGGVSYTVDTLAELKQSRPADELFFLLGADALADLPEWREPRRILELATPLVVRRPGSPELDFSRLSEIASAARIAQIRGLQIEMPQIDISSRDLRQRVAEGRSIRYRTPRSVEKYIETAGLYRS